MHGQIVKGHAASSSCRLGEGQDKRASVNAVDSQVHGIEAVPFRISASYKDLKSIDEAKII